jgi:EAL domain-containing protein (putative c-di-GMP-specific phosphodiesterase class I)
MIKRPYIVLFVILVIALVVFYVLKLEYLTFIALGMLVVESIWFYIKNESLKIVIHKKRLRNIKLSNLGDYYVLFIELSNLNTYTQFYDIETGDMIAKSIYRELRSKVARKNIYFYRNDQIVVLMPFAKTVVINQNHRFNEQYSNASVILKFIQNHQYQVGNAYYEVNANIGVAAQGGIQHREQSLNDLIALAHFSMIKAKERNLDIVVANEELRTIKIDLDGFNKGIDSGLRYEEFNPFFLPVIDTETMNVIGCEALVRWRKDSYRIIEASKFKDIAIEKNLFVEIDKQVITKAFANYFEWINSDIVNPGFKLTINLSYQSLLQIRAVDIHKLAQTYGIDPKDVEIDISEEIRITHDSLDAIRNLKSFGFSISLDTFNNQWFSLDLLLEIDFDMIKIDKSRLPEENLTDRQIELYKTIVTFSKSTNLRTLSKGIENKFHLELAKDLKVDFVQGYYFTPPLDAENIIIFLNKYRNGILG